MTMNSADDSHLSLQDQLVPLKPEGYELHDSGRDAVSPCRVATLQLVYLRTVATGVVFKTESLALLNGADDNYDERYKTSV